MRRRGTARPTRTRRIGAREPALYERSAIRRAGGGKRASGRRGLRAGGVGERPHRPRASLCRSGRPPRGPPPGSRGPVSVARRRLRGDSATGASGMGVAGPRVRRPVLCHDLLRDPLCGLFVRIGHSLCATPPVPPLTPTPLRQGLLGCPGVPAPLDHPWPPYPARTSAAAGPVPLTCPAAPRPAPARMGVRPRPAVAPPGPGPRGPWRPGGRNPHSGRTPRRGRVPLESEKVGTRD